MEPGDFDLLRSYCYSNDERAFARLVKRHGPWIHAAARRRLKDNHFADDATQAVFVVLASKATQLVATARHSLEAWLFHVMHFTCSRLRRTEGRQASLIERAERVVGHCDRTLMGDSRLLLLLEDGVAQLEAGDREVVVRRFYRQQGFTEIGVALQISSEAARKRVHRALAQVKAAMIRDGIDVIPDTLWNDMRPPRRRPPDGTHITRLVKERLAMSEEQFPPTGGHQMISAEFLVQDVEANLAFFEKLGFPRRFVDTPDATGRIPRASVTAGKLGKIWIRRAPEAQVQPSSSINVFFWIDGGPDGLIAHRQKVAAQGVPVTAIIDEHALPNFNVTTPDGYSIAFFTAYVAPGQPPIPLVL